jgi:trimeric autotransporter adhesin
MRRKRFGSWHSRRGMALGTFVAFTLALAACAMVPEPPPATPLAVTPPPAIPPAATLPALVRDINAGSVASVTAPTDFAVLDDVAYFLAGDASGSRTLWQSDGTAAGTHIVIDSPNSTMDNGILGLRRAGAQLFFFAATGPSSAYELWRSDGTAQDTEAIAPLGFGADAFISEHERPQIAAAGDTLYFISGTDPRGPTLFRSDGTTAGTVPLLFFEPLEFEPVRVESFTPAGDQLFFTATHTPKGEKAVWRALYRSDGTKDGTRLLYEHETAALTSVGTKLFFYGDDGLMVSDGTLEGTQPLKQLRGSFAHAAVGERLFFAAADNQLWTSDGTEAGTILVRRFGANVQQIVALAGVGKRLFIVTRGAEDQTFTLWASDGTEAGTAELRTFRARLADDAPHGFTAAGDTLYFVADDEASGAELWHTDGTKDGTRLVRDIGTGAANGVPQNEYARIVQASSDPPAGTFYAAQLGNRLLFSASDGHAGLTLWATDGTEVGTTLLLEGRAGSASSSPIGLRTLGQRLLFFANDDTHGVELWTSDGSEQGTAMIADINPGAEGSLFNILTTILFHREPAVIGDKLYFTGLTGKDLRFWVSDGTVPGTTPVQDDDVEATLTAALARAGDGARAFGMANAGDTVYFYRPTPESGDLQLWRSDGMPAGTQLVSEATIAGRYEMDFGTPPPPVSLDGKLLFLASDPEHGRELWTSDGTTAGTRLLKDIEPGKDDGYPFALTAAGGHIFFVANTKASGLELWVSDGSESGTMLVKDIKPAPSMPTAQPESFDRPKGGLCRLDPLRPDSALLTYDNGVYFMGDDGEHGCELWRSDGTATGTTMVADINPGTGDVSQLRRGAVLVAPMVIGPDDRLYFAADDGVHGVELWATDGTPAGTAIVADINPGASTANPSAMYVAADRLYFAADDGVHGVELWATDGTPAGTAIVADINPGAASASPFGLRVAGDRLFFDADDGVHGIELWTLPLGGK